MGENTIRAAASGLLLLVLWLVFGGFIADGAGRDAFQWWSEVWIPLGVGATTVLVSAVALIASSRATRIAHEVERQRELATAERAEDEQRYRLQAMAVDDARALMGWAIEASRNRWWVHSDLAKVGPELHGPTLAHIARGALRQSLVPGASELLALTEKEIENLWGHMPDEVWMPDAIYSPGDWYPSSSFFEVVVSARAARITDRIRRWGIDPIAAARHLSIELEAMNSDEGAFFDYRLGLNARGLRPLSELPEPPAAHAERVAWMQDRGLGPEADVEAPSRDA